MGDSALDIDSYIETGKSEDEKAVNQRFMDWAGKPVEELVKVFTERTPDRSLESIKVKALTFNQVDPAIYKDWVEGRLDRFFDGHDSERFLKNIKCKTLVLQAENGMISLDEVIWARALKEDLMVKQMTGFNHGLGIQDGRESPVISEIINFLFSL